MNNSLSTGGGDMLNTKEFRNRMVHAVFNGEETDYDKVIRPVYKTSPSYFALGLFSSMMGILPPILLVVLKGFSVVGSWNVMFILLAISVLFFTVAYFSGKKETNLFNKRNKLLDYEYMLNSEEIEFLKWHRFNIQRESYPVCVIEPMLSTIDDHDYVNKEFVNKTNISNLSKKGK